jgi:hypothetical protein
MKQQRHHPMKIPALIGACFLVALKLAQANTGKISMPQVNNYGTQLQQYRGVGILGGSLPALNYHRLKQMARQLQEQKFNFTSGDASLLLRRNRKQYWLNGCKKINQQAGLINYRFIEEHCYPKRMNRTN